MSKFCRQLIVIKEFIADDSSAAITTFSMSPIDAWEDVTSFAASLGLWGEEIEERIGTMCESVVDAQNELFKNTLTWLNDRHIEQITLNPKYDNETCWVLGSGFPCVVIMWIEDENYYAISWTCDQ